MKVVDLLLLSRIFFCKIAIITAFSFLQETVFSISPIPQIAYTFFDLGVIRAKYLEKERKLF